ncbi:MAG: DUF397 domain-containing protein [Pseudonocardiaceae bacterium]
MQRINNGMTASLLRGVSWQKSRYSNPCGSCVEVAQLADGRVAVRNSRHPGGPALIYPRAGMAAFVHGVQVGEFDHMTGGSDLKPTTFVAGNDPFSSPTGSALLQ